MFESDLYSYLQTAIPGINLFPGKVPQRLISTYPRVVYATISGESDLIIRGPSGLAYTVIQFDAYAQSDLAACTAREQLRMSLQGFTGRMGSTLVQNSVWRELPAVYETGVDASDNGTFRKCVEVKFSYGQVVPGLAAPLPKPAAAVGYFADGYFG